MTRPGRSTTPPDVRAALLAMDGVDPAACPLVEDPAPGVAAGRAAGMPGAVLCGLDGDLRLADLGQLAGWLRDREPWWTRSVGYQIYLPSFQDSDGDGWGDLPGVTARLDHLADLGVDLLWLTPFFVSPMADHGYDIADYLRVDPRYGGEAALDELLERAHRRGMKVLGDLVVNHTSDQHPWFQQARASRDDPYRDYYLWRDPAPDGGPPNNWLSFFGGPAWTLDPRTGQYYLHLFRPEQPDLNWRNPAVVAEVDAVLEHWLGRGLDGFRIDTAALLLKHPDLPDNPMLPDGEVQPIRGVAAPWRRQDHRYDLHQPEVHHIHQHWRQVADRYGAFLVGEIYELDPLRLAEFVTEERLHSSFWFGLVESDWEPERVRTMLAAAAQASPRLSWVQGNHDRPRTVSRYGGGVTGRRRSLALHVLMAFLPGTFWLYQGEELGLESGQVPADLVQDPLGLAEPEQSRDVARTPMPWSPRRGLGFTDGRPWLPDGSRTSADTVEVQRADPGSHLAVVRRLLRARARLLRDRPARAAAPLYWGLPDAGHPHVVAYRRDDVTVLANLGDETVDIPGGLHGCLVFDTDPSGDTGPPRRLRAHQAVVLVHP